MIGLLKNGCHIVTFDMTYLSSLCSDSHEPGLRFTERQHFATSPRHWLLKWCPNMDDSSKFYFYFSGLSHHLGSQESFRISIFHFVLSSVSFNPTFRHRFCTSLSTWFSCLPLLFPGTGASTIPLSTCPLSVLLTCPYTTLNGLFSVISLSLVPLLLILSNVHL